MDATVISNNVVEMQGTDTDFFLVNKNKYFTIDDATRKITPSADFTYLGVESDSGAKRIWFECPRYVGDDLDLTELNVYINYQNANGEKDRWYAEDVTIDSDKIHFSWNLERKVLKYKGTVKFIVCAIETDAEGEKDPEWNTTLCTGTVLEGLEVDNPQPDTPEYDIINQLISLCTEKSGLLYYGDFLAAPSPNEWFTFTLNTEGTGYSVKANFVDETVTYSNIVIPYEYNGLPVTEISAGGFANLEVIVEVIIPNTVTAIKEKAFQECINLSKVILPQNIEVLSDSLFEGCASLTRIDLPNGIREIQYDVFRKTSIEYMDLPYGITYIGETLFAENTKLKRVNIPDTVTRLGARAFYKCTSLEEITIPNSVVTIEYNQFTSCTNLKRVVIGTGITKLSSGTFCYCNNLETVIIPKTVMSIGKDDFWDTGYKPNPNTTLYVEQGSYAEEYAKQYKMNYCYVAINEFPGAVDMSAYLKKTEFDTKFQLALVHAKQDLIAFAPSDNDLNNIDVAPSLAVMDYYINKAITEFAQRNGLV